MNKQWPTKLPLLCLVSISAKPFLDNQIGIRFWDFWEVLTEIIPRLFYELFWKMTFFICKLLLGNNISWKIIWSHCLTYVLTLGYQLKTWSHLDKRGGGGGERVRGWWPFGPADLPNPHPGRPSSFSTYILLSPKLPSCSTAKEKTELSSLRKNIVERTRVAATNCINIWVEKNIWGKKYLREGKGFSNIIISEKIFFLCSFPTSQGVDLQACSLDHIFDNLLEWHLFRGRLLLQFLPPHDFGHETSLSCGGGGG